MMLCGNYLTKSWKIEKKKKKEKKRKEKLKK